MVRQHFDSGLSLKLGILVDDRVDGAAFEALSPDRGRLVGDHDRGIAAAKGGQRRSGASIARRDDIEAGELRASFNELSEKVTRSSSEASRTPTTSHRGCFSARTSRKPPSLSRNARMAFTSVKSATWALILIGSPA
jgi:hypothetical protein